MKFIEPTSQELVDKYEQIKFLFQCISDKDKVDSFFHNGAIEEYLQEDYPDNKTFKFKYDSQNIAYFFCGNNKLSFQKIAKYFHHHIGQQFKSSYNISSFSYIKPEVLYSISLSEGVNELFYLVGMRIDFKPYSIALVLNGYKYVYGDNPVWVHSTRVYQGIKDVELTAVIDTDFKSLADFKEVELNATGEMYVDKLSGIRFYRIPSFVTLDPDSIYNWTKVNEDIESYKKEMIKKLKEYNKMRRMLDSPENFTDFLSKSLNSSRILSRKQIIALDERIVNFNVESNNQVSFTLNLYGEPIFDSNGGYPLRYNSPDYKKVKFICDLDEYVISVNLPIYHSGHTGGKICMGSYSSEMTFAMDERDYPKLIHSLLTFVSNRNTHDARGGTSITKNTLPHLYSRNTRGLKVDILTPEGPIDCSSLSDCTSFSWNLEERYRSNGELLNRGYYENLASFDGKIYLRDGNNYYDFWTEEPIEITREGIGEIFSGQYYVFNLIRR